MKTIFALLLCLVTAAAEAQIARPVPGETIPGNPGIAPSEPPIDEPPIVEEFFGPGRYQLITAAITIDGRERAVVLRLDTVTGKVWMLEAMPNVLPGRPALRFVEVQDNLPRARPGFPSGGFSNGSPGTVGIEISPPRIPTPQNR